MNLDPILQAWSERVLEKVASIRQDVKKTGTWQSLQISGGGTKSFLGESTEGEVFSTREYAGVIDYEPSELVVRVKSGTALRDLENLLGSKEQMLGFEPPHFGEATVGGMVAAGLSGPRRATAGSVRDFVLGTQLLDGKGQVLNFGGQVMKNVAGYDVSRLLCGSLGILGLITEVSLKVLPVPFATKTLVFEKDQVAALGLMNQWSGRPLPISAISWSEAWLHVRLAGAQNAVDSAALELGGEALESSAAAHFWESLREQTNSFFLGFNEAKTSKFNLWRLSIPSTAPVVPLQGQMLIEWGGAQRWLITDETPEAVRQAAICSGGTAMLFRGRAAVPRIARPDPITLKIHSQLKREFDPDGVFNRGRLFAEL